MQKEIEKYTKEKQLQTKRQIPDDLLLPKDISNPLWINIILAGVKNRPMQDQLRTAFSRPGKPMILRRIHMAVTDARPSSTDFAYCTGINYFLKQQLVLYTSMTPSTTIRHARSFVLSVTADKNLASFIMACNKISIDRSCVSNGRAYLAAMQKLIRLQKEQFLKSGPYTSARIARAVLWAYGPVKDWEGVTVQELGKVSADQKGFLEQFQSDMLVSELAAMFGCFGELVTMYACLRAFGDL